MHVVLLGNCQVETLGRIIQRFVPRSLGITTDFVDAYNGINDNSYARLARAECVVAQATTQPPPLTHDHIPNGVKLHLVPSVNGGFLYPYQDVRHPSNPSHRVGNQPYTREYNDRFLAKLLVAGTAPEEALARYRAHDVAREAHVGRLYELAMQGQRQVDAAAGYACADIIERFLGEEQLFQSAFHFSGRIARHLAGTLCDRIGLDAKYGQRIRDHLREAPFVPRFVPVHPSVAAFFGMRWVTEHTCYPFLWEGRFTFDEYVLRFMQARWSEALQEGVLDAQSGRPGARAKLEIGLAEAPGSAMGAHELSRILEAEGDLAGALTWQQRAASLDEDAMFSRRLGHVLWRSGDIAGAAGAFSRAVALDPIHDGGWAGLRDCLIRLERIDEAWAAARQVVLYAPDPTGAQAILDRLAETRMRYSGGSRSL